MQFQDALDQVNKGQIRLKSIMVCNYCNYAVPKNKLMKCSGKHCSIMLCKNCATFINDKPFCNTCILKIMREKSVLIITKGDI
jgi:hypothetical protein